MIPADARAATEGGEAAALLAKHRAYVGWAIGDGVVKTLRAEGRAVRAGTVSMTMTELRYGVAYRDTFHETNGLEHDNGFTGSVFWTSNANGFTVRPVGETVRYLADHQAVFGERTSDSPATVVRRESIDGVETTLLRVTPQVGFPMNVWIDPNSGAFKRVVIDPDGKYETTLNGIGYTEQSGKRFLSSWRYGSSNTSYSFDKIEINPALGPEELRPPKQRATWSFGDGTAPVELTRDTSPRILIDATMNGVRGKFILDTGAGSTVLVDSFARKIGAKRLGDTRISGIAAGAAAGVFSIASIAIGPSILHDVIAVSGMDEQWVSRDGVVGLIGFDMLGGAIVDLDLDHGTLRVLDPRTTQPNESEGLVVHADLSNRHIRVPMKLNGRYDVIATLDSGNPVNVLFSRDLIDRDRVTFFSDPTQLGSTRYGRGVAAGYEIEHCGRLSSLALGPIVYQPVPACDSPSFARNEVLVGLDFMKAFNYVFDYPDGIIVMTPRKSP